jgi:hypothetical protein
MLYFIAKKRGQIIILSIGGIGQGFDSTVIWMPFIAIWLSGSRTRRPYHQ